MKFDVFISYSNKDKVIADAACATLEAAGIRCWIAPRDVLPGADWGASIIDALDSCRAMVLIFSSSANESPQIRNEVVRAVNRGVPIIPVRIENIEPTRAMAYFMAAVHWLDALTPPLENHLQHLAVSVSALLRLPDNAEKDSEVRERAADKPVEAVRFEADPAVVDAAAIETSQAKKEAPATQECTERARQTREAGAKSWVAGGFARASRGESATDNRATIRDIGTAPPSHPSRMRVWFAVLYAAGTLPLLIGPVVKFTDTLTSFRADAGHIYKVFAAQSGLLVGSVLALGLGAAILIKCRKTLTPIERALYWLGMVMPLVLGVNSAASLLFTPSAGPAFDYTTTHNGFAYGALAAIAAYFWVIRPRWGSRPSGGQLFVHWIGSVPILTALFAGVFGGKNVRSIFEYGPDPHSPYLGAILAGFVTSLLFGVALLVYALVRRGRR